MPEPQHIEFVPTIASGFRAALEELFFFNSRQGLLHDGIRKSVERFGYPEILERDGRLWIGVPSDATQCLFAVDQAGDSSRLAGVVLYLRTAPEVLCIAHIAVHPEYAFGGTDSHEGVGLLLIEQVRQIARRINGVRRLELPYRLGCFLPIATLRVALPMA